MSRIIKYGIMAWLLLFFSGNLLMAAVPGDFNPSNPPEPMANFKVVTKCSTNAYTSGDGTYASGSEVYISTSANDINHQFAYWLKDGKKYTEEQYFTYIVGKESVTFEAVYDFMPVNPSEPSAPNAYRVYLESSPKGCCSFNRTSGSKEEAGNYVEISVYPNQGYQFLGWFDNGKKIGSSQTFYHFMPTNDITLTARFVYNPTNPDEPNGTGQTGVSNNSAGDVNNDGVINTSDAVLLINHYVAGTTNEISSSVADLNADGVINTTDAVLLINKYVTGSK